MGDVRAGGGLFQSGLPIEAINIDKYPIPAFGCCDVVGALNQDGRIILQVKTPQNFGWRPCSVINGPLKADAGKSTSVYKSEWMRALYDSTDGSPKAGEVWGPIQDKACKMRKYVPGGKILRDQTANDGPQVSVPKDTILIQRYDPGAIWGQAKGTIQAGTVDTPVNLVWYNKDLSHNTTPFSLFQNVTNINFNVTEATGLLSVPVAYNSYVKAQWDEGSQKYHLVGWNC